MLELLQSLPEVLKFDWPDLMKILFGAGLVGFLAWGWVRSIRKATRAQIKAEKHRTEAEVEREKAEFHKAIAELRTSHADEKDRLREDARDAERLRDQAETNRERAVAALVPLQRRLADLEAFDGRLWERDNRTTPPNFTSATDRGTRILSVVNLKGGVGKTTLAANVGVSLARRGRRVLLVDLDFQSSLTRLCVSPDLLQNLITNRRTTSCLLDPAAEPSLIGELARPLLHPTLADRVCHVLAADERLAEAELRAQARWLVTEQPDARFLFRPLFHSAEVLGRYDFILFDCPPRLTTACVNALSCSDFLLVPVLLEQGSVEAIPRTLNWLTRLPHVTRARLLGVVANRVTLYRGKLIAAQQTIYNYLPETIRQTGFQGPPCFHTFVHNDRAVVEDAANSGQVAAMADEGFEMFAAVTGEVASRVML